MSDLPLVERRRIAVQAAIDGFRDSPLIWGDADCLRLAYKVLNGFGVEGLPKLPNYKTELGAIRALKKAGFEDLTDALDSVCHKVPASKRIIGDLAVLPSDGALDAIVVCAGMTWVGWKGDDSPLVNIKLKPDELPQTVFTYV